jgi:hypothetical protein
MLINARALLLSHSSATCRIEEVIVTMKTLPWSALLIVLAIGDGTLTSPLNASGGTTAAVTWPGTLGGSSSQETN